MAEDNAADLRPIHDAPTPLHLAFRAELVGGHLVGHIEFGPAARRDLRANTFAGFVTDLTAAFQEMAGRAVDEADARREAETADEPQAPAVPRGMPSRAVVEGRHPVTAAHRREPVRR